MTLEEKRAWIRLIVSVAAYGAYAFVVLSQTGDHPLAEVPYAAALLWSVGAAILATIVIEIVVGALNPRASLLKDERDREIGRLGDHVGQAFVVIGAVAAMLMAIAGWERFWIANVIYVCFVLSSILGNVAKVLVYRRSLPQW
jgi:branched-subunit amino acid ABC-type transport system permease component